MGRLHKAHAGQSRGHPIGAPTHLADGIGPGVFRFPDGPSGKVTEHGLFPSVLIFELFQRPFDVALQALPRR